jgi:hypothetical protein
MPAAPHPGWSISADITIHLRNSGSLWSQTNAIHWQADMMRPGEPWTSKPRRTSVDTALAFDEIMSSAGPNFAWVLELSMFHVSDNGPRIT